jgi:hypothetical protein
MIVSQRSSDPADGMGGVAGRGLCQPRGEAEDVIPLTSPGKVPRLFERGGNLIESKDVIARPTRRHPQIRGGSSS